MSGPDSQETRSSAGPKTDDLSKKGRNPKVGRGHFSSKNAPSIIDDYPTYESIRRRYELLKPVLDERLRRLWVAAEALSLGAGGVAALAEATGLSRTTIRAGIEELRGAEADLAQLAKEGRVRRPGAGRKMIIERDVTLEGDLEGLLESSQERGNHALDWTCKSIRGLAEELGAMGHQVSYRTVGNLLHRLGFCFSPAESYRVYPLASRREQFRRLSHRTDVALANGEPVISLGFTDTSRHQLVRPEAGVFRLAAAALHYWWQESGIGRFSGVRRMLLLLDSVGSPATNVRRTLDPLLQPMSGAEEMEILVGQFPPGARRWRRSVRELHCSCSRAVTSGTDQTLAIELELILTPDTKF